MSNIIPFPRNHKSVGALHRYTVGGMSCEVVRDIVTGEIVCARMVRISKMKGASLKRYLQREAGKPELVGHLEWALAIRMVAHAEDVWPDDEEARADLLFGRTRR